MATYIGVAVFVLTYVGWTAYELLWLRKRAHFVPLLDVDLDTDAVWGPGDGVRVRAEDQAAREKRDAQDLADGRRWRVLARSVLRYIA